MKGFPEDPGGSRGPWYQRVNRAVGAVSKGCSKARLLELLGEPDRVEAGGASAPGDFQRVMESVAGGSTLIRYGNTEPTDEVLFYRDPYRPRVYAFGMRSGVVETAWQEAASTSVQSE